ncbi:hypothetical protein AVEN_17114-1 [Araneus ventricosus]|uniref:Uncharacterized protein n=1 Tax=Araneus ventricosus TaxID=182803 RepID=A0A4Y2X4F7_ARAVE|nr:hypothetical protein AVEN_17114-1 [Araneus ventricosus]
MDFGTRAGKTQQNLWKRANRLVMFGIPSGMKSERAGNENSALKEKFAIIVVSRAKFCRLSSCILERFQLYSGCTGCTNYAWTFSEK